MSDGQLTSVPISGRYFPRVRDDVGIRGLLNDLANHEEVFPAHAFEQKWQTGWVVYGDLIGIDSLTRRSTAIPLNHVTKFQALCVAATRSSPARHLIQFSDSTFATFLDLSQALRYATRLMHLCMALNWDTMERRAVSGFHEMVVPSFGISRGRYFVGRIAAQEDAPERFDHLRIIVGEAVTKAVRLQEAALMGTVLVGADRNALSSLTIAPTKDGLPLVRWHKAIMGDETHVAWNTLRLAELNPFSWPWFYATANQDSTSDGVRAAHWQEYTIAMDVLRRTIDRWLDSFYAGVPYGDLPPQVAKHGMGLARFAAASDMAARYPTMTTARPGNWRRFLEKWEAI